MKISDMVETIRQRVKTRLSEFEGIAEIKVEASCFWHTMTAWRFLNERIKDGTFPAGSRSLIQAGTLSWPIVPEDQDDGVSPTHYTYLYEPDNPMNFILMLTGQLPEMHCWNAVTIPGKSPVLIDLCTRYLPEMMRTTCVNGPLEWRTPAPPDYIWRSAHSIPHRVRYEPDLKAISTVLNCAKHAKMMTDKELKSYVRGE